MGILNYLRSQSRPWLGSRLAKRTGAEQQLTSRKIKTQSIPGYLQPLPWFDRNEIDTPEKRRAYRQMLRTPMVKSGLLAKLFATACLDLSVLGEDDGNKVDRQTADFCKYATLKMEGGIAGLVVDLVLPLLVDGYTIGDKIWKPFTRGKYGGKWAIRRIDVKHPDLYRPLVNEYGQITEIEGMGPATGERYSPEGFVFVSYLKMYGNPLGQSDLAAVYESYWRLDATWKLRHCHLKNLNGPFLVGHYTNNADKPALDDALEGAKSGGWASVPPEVTLEVFNLAASGTRDYEAAIQDLRQDIAVGVTLAFLQMIEGAKTGARSIGEVHQSSAELGVWYIAEILAHILKDQIYPDLCDLNYVGFSGYPTPSFGGINDVDLAPSLAIDQGLYNMGVGLSEIELRERYNRAAPKDALDTIQRKDQPAGLTPSAGGFPGGPTNPAITSFAERDVAGGVKDSRQAQKLLAGSVSTGHDDLASLVRSALKRIGSADAIRKSPRLFNGTERQQLIESLASTNATAYLLGQARMRERLAMAARGRRNFTEEPTQYAQFDEYRAVNPMAPEKAFNYFRGLYPSLSGDPQIFGELMRRQAFTLAAATEDTLLRNVQNTITEALAGDDASMLEGPRFIQQLMDNAGVSVRNPQYSEMVYRTNMMDAYNQGTDQELKDPDVQEAFPVWRYDGIDDERAGEDHRPKFGKYYPSDAAFAEVRGDRPYNCRCVPTPIYVDDWQRLLDKGEQVETSW